MSNWIKFNGDPLNTDYVDLFFGRYDYKNEEFLVCARMAHGTMDDGSAITITEAYDTLAEARERLAEIEDLLIGVPPTTKVVWRKKS